MTRLLGSDRHLRRDSEASHGVALLIVKFDDSLPAAISADR